MKVLQLTVHYHPNVGGVETHLSDLVNGLVSKNIPTVVLAYRPLVTKTPWNLIENKSKLRIFRIPWFPGLFYKFVKSPLLEFLYLFPGLFFVTPFIVLIENPDVIHAHGIVAGFIGVFWGNAFGKRVVISTHSLYQFPIGGLYRSFVRTIFKRTDKVLTLSNQSKKEVIDLGIDNEKVETFTYWIDLDNFRPVKNAKRKVGWNGKLVVLFVGRLVPEKGIPELLEAAKTWNKNITLAIAGSGPMEEEIRNSKLVISNLEYLGNLDQSDLPKYYSAADLVIVPSTHEEGFGRVILESLACGTPVVGSKRGAIPEAIDSTVGSLININSISIKKEIESLSINTKKRSILSHNARKYAEKRYSVKNIDNIIVSYTN